MKKKTQKKPQGIGGWLILPTIGLFVGAAVWIFNFLVWGMALILGDIDFMGLVLFFMSIVFGFLIILAVVFEFKKKKQFPKLSISILWLMVAASFVLAFMDGDYSGLIQSILGSILWTFYFTGSKRVKNTFVN